MDAQSIRERLQTLVGERYRVDRILGEGGFGHVFEAEDLRLGGVVAIKVLRPELLRHAGARARFAREARMLAELRHPHIVPILDAFEGDELCAFVMPRVAGSSLRARIDAHGALPIDEALQIAAEIGDALDFAHRKGKLHRDLKPANILLADGHALLADFGIARAIEVGEDGAGLTQTGAVLGSPGYMSPEQFAGSGHVDGRSDLYGLAVILYEMLAGVSPFASRSPEAIYRQQTLGTPPSLQVLRTSVPSPLSSAIARGLASNPPDRFSTAGEMIAACRRDVLIPPVGTRLPSKAIMAAAALVLLAGGIAAWIHFFPPSAGSGKAREPSATRLWLVVAPPAVDPPEPQLAAAARSVVEAALNDDSGTGAITDHELTNVLRSAMLPESTTVTATLARGLAVRANAAGLVETNIDRSSEGAVISVRAVLLDRDSTLAEFTRRTPRGADILPALTVLAGKLSASLRTVPGWCRTEKDLAATQQGRVRTPDLRALQMMRLAGQMEDAGQEPAVIVLYRAAIARDSAFANAWQGLGVAYSNLGLRDSAASALEQALRFPERIGPMVEIDIQSMLHLQRGEYADVLRADDILLRNSPTSWRLWNGKGVDLYALADYDASIDCFEKARGLAVDAPDVLLGNEIGTLVAAARLAEARVDLARITDPMQRRRFGLFLAMAGDDPDTTRKIAQELIATHEDNVNWLTTAHVALAGDAASRGEYRHAESALTNAAAAAVASNNVFAIQYVTSCRCLLALAFGRPPSHQPAVPRRDRSLDGSITYGLEALERHQPEVAREAARDLSRRFGAYPAMLGGAPELLTAWAAAQEGRWSDVVATGRSIALDRRESYLVNRRAAARWLMARAFEQLAQPDSAAYYYRLVLGRQDLDETGLAGIALVRSSALQRLAILAIRQGQAGPARQDADRFLRAFQNPDPELQSLVDEVHVAFAIDYNGRSAESASPSNPKR